MNTNQPAVYDPLTRTLHWLTVAGFIGIPTTIVLWTIYSGLTKIRTKRYSGLTKIRTRYSGLTKIRTNYSGLTKIRTRRRSRRQ
ncbi:hypothetical protein [Neisseria meningitidis]|uniref:hypothetical protein n=1 Tax=Neisseria meningitidis TaxID=487 RepID=UPI0011873648|nr:hypothetical protein [Neisseria meningitidis]